MMSLDSTLEAYENLGTPDGRFSDLTGDYLFTEVLDYINVNRPILEIGSGKGHSSLLLLSGGRTETPTLTSIERDSDNIDDLQSIKNIFGDRFNYHICSSEDYDIDNDSNKNNYQLVVIDGVVSTLQHDLELARSTSADAIWLLNTQDDSSIDGIAENFYDNSGFFYERNLRMFVSHGDSDRRMVNTTLMLR